MIQAAEAVIWINDETHQVMVRPYSYGTGPRRKFEDWGDPIGAAYASWHTMSNDQRMLLMLETAIDLTMQGFQMKDVLIAFADVKEFRDLGTQSYPMCRALTSAIVGQCLEPNTMGFEELLQAHQDRS